MWGNENFKPINWFKNKINATVDIILNLNHNMYTKSVTQSFTQIINLKFKVGKKL